MSFGVWTQVGLGNHVFSGGLDPLVEGAILEVVPLLKMHSDYKNGQTDQDAIRVVDRAPSYLLNHVIPVSAIVSRQRLRSAQQNTLVVPRYRLTTYGR